MTSLNVDQIHSMALAIGELKQQLIAKLPHAGAEAVYLQNDEMTTGLMNNETEIKLHLLTGQFLYFHNEKGHFFDATKDDVSEKLKEITDIYSLKFPETQIENISMEQLHAYRDFATHTQRSLDLFRMGLEGNFTLVHLWPHNFDFSVEWFTGNSDEQIGTGISPGDEQYAKPYFYMNPWPFNEKVTEEKLPIGIWHTAGWNGIKVEWSELSDMSAEEIAKKISELFVIAKKNFS